jgi:hypothetical protein
VILRELITFADGGADVFFGEPELDTADLLRSTSDGRGVITCLELPDVQTQPLLFSSFLMWLLADLFQDLPEVGDVDKPKLVFFFDEAHLLFTGASKEFVAVDRADRAADPQQGRRRLLRDADPQGRACRGARPARQPDPARSARVHTRGRKGVARHGFHVPEVRLRPRRAAHPAWHR